MKELCEQQRKEYEKMSEAVTIPENISRRIRAIRYLGITGVVFCHAVQNPYFFFTGEFFTLSQWELAGNKLIGFTHSLIIYGLFYGAVPMFFLFSGYLQTMIPRPYGETVLRRVRSLILPMVLWSVFSIVFFSLLGKTVDPAFSPKQFSNSDWHAWFNALVGNYSNAWIRGTHCPGLMYQFWFIRDLFVMTLLSPVIIKLMKTRCSSIISLAVFGTLLALGYRPVIAGGDALFYFSLGTFFAMRKIDFFALLDRFWNWGFALALATLAVGLMYYRYDGNPDPDVPMWVQLSSALLLMKLSGIIAASGKAYEIAKCLDGQAFFLYCAHAPVMMLLCTYMAYHISCNTMNALLEIALIIIAGIVNTAVCTGVGFLLKRFLPGVFALATGGRKAVKT